MSEMENSTDNAESELRHRFPSMESSHSTKNGNAYHVNDGTGLRVDKNSNDPLSQLSILLDLKEKIEQSRINLAARIDTQLSDFVQEINMEIESIKKNTSSGCSFESPKKNNSNAKNGDDLPEKEFIIRESLLTELFEISHIKTIYHIFVAMLVVLFMQTFLYDLLEHGKFNLDFGMIQFAFGKIQLVIVVWLCMKLSVILLVFPTFHFWAYNRNSLKSKGIPDVVFTTIFVVYLVILFIIPARIILIDDIPPASSAIILCEQIRLAMKSYAFVRSNVPRAKSYQKLSSTKDDINPDNKSEEFEKVKETNRINPQNFSNSPCPSFSNFLYFLFAPTLVYRDSYPRMPGPVRWRYVTSNFVQVVACLFYTYYIFQRFCVPVFQRFGHEPMSYRGLLLSIFGCMMPGTLALIINFFLILHAWMNAFAEMLTFGDRMFYKDWWNSTTYANYYRTWNIVIHDWLYTYIYRDCYRFFKPNRKLPMIIVFVMSAIVHEYIISLMFSYFYPIMLVLFLGMGVFFVFLTDKRKSRFWNIFFWVSMFIGPGIFMTVYCMEIYARTNCPQYYESTVVDFFVPRSWFCYHQEEIKP